MRNTPRGPQRTSAKGRTNTRATASKIPTLWQETERGTPRSVLPTHPTAATDGTHTQPSGGCIPSRTKKFGTPANFEARSPEAASPQLYRPGTPSADDVSDGSASGLGAGLAGTARDWRPPRPKR